MINKFIKLLNYYYKIEHKSINYVLIVKYLIKIIELLRNEEDKYKEALILKQIYHNIKP
jgi:hypothetical protein